MPCSISLFFLVDLVDGVPDWENAGGGQEMPLWWTGHDLHPFQPHGAG